MEVLALAILKTLTTSFVKIYITIIFGGGQSLLYDKADLGYKVPGWYMTASDEENLYGFGTSIKGDEFESLDDAMLKAREQMASSLRLSHRRLVDDHVRYESGDLRQKRLVELFVRAEGLEDFIMTNATVEKREMVRVSRPEEDMRAFVRVTLPAGLYADYQGRRLKELKKTLMHMKMEDILAEMDAELESGRGRHSVPEGRSSAPSSPSPAEDRFRDLEGETRE